MRKLSYNNAADTQRFEFPSNWITPTAVTITVVGTDGSSLLAATAATLYTATTTNGAVTAGASTFIIDGASAMVPGDRFRLSKTGEHPEDVEILSFATSTKTAATKHALDYGHADESAVSALWCTYDLDTSTVATWPEGLPCSVIWTPNTDDPPFVEDAIVYRYVGAEVPGWREYLRNRYPNVYNEAIGRLDTLYEDARMELAWFVQAQGHDLNSLREPEFIRLPIAALIAGYIARNQGDAGQYEAERADKDFQRYAEILGQSHVWVDEDQDLAKDEGEVVQFAWSALGPGRFGSW